MHLSDDASSNPVLALDHLAVGFGAGGGTWARAVQDVSYSVGRDETRGVVGESGSGKSVALMACFGLLPPSGRVLSGTARFCGRDLLNMKRVERQRMLGREVGFIFQNPVGSLDPVFSIGDQLVEALRIHDRKLPKRAALNHAEELLQQVGISEPRRRLSQYPHEFSGGMAQRVMIAIALANKPQLLIADEPTTAVDATIQAQILDLLRDLKASRSGAAILVSHDLGVIAENTDSLSVMYAGQVMEAGATADVLANPQHPYTMGLLSCRPSLISDARLIPIPGQPPSISTAQPQGCPFQPRCPVGQGKAVCGQEIPPFVPTATGMVACHFPGIEAFLPEGRVRHRPASASALSPLLQLTDIRVDFPLGRPAFWQKKRHLRAVNDVSVDVLPGEALGVVGESGSGKSTLARVMMRLEEATRGRVVFDGRDVTRLGRSQLGDFRDRVQMVFQDPLNSLNPRLTVGDNAAEPWRVRGWSSAERRIRVVDVFGEVGLEALHFDRGVTEMSGGQLQRVGIARALVLEPDVIVMDEPVSALDVSVQAQILNLLCDLKEARGLAYVFISHDMAVVKYLCDRVVVMHDGVLVESAPTDEIFRNPRENYTRKLLSAVPEIGMAEATKLTGTIT
ncbi:MAG: ABC transporter ATP-binding protein [Roseovarius sp.]